MIPSYLANIKSSGMYRFVWDKSQVDNSSAEIMRLCVGYSEKGPFNTPVYIKTKQDFIKIFGGISKKLEKRGVFFHRNCLQALTAGPIYCLNLKKFSYDADEKYSTVKGITFNPKNTTNDAGEPQYVSELQTLKVEDIYDTTRFWNLNPSAVIDAVSPTSGKEIMDKYISIVAADSKESSNTVFVRGTSNKNYDVTIKEWFTSVTTEEMPSYLEGYEDTLLSDYLIKVFVFKGQFTKDLVSTSSLKKYFDIDADGNPVLKKYIVNSFGDKVDALSALAADDASGFINSYEGVTLPYFKDARNSYISLDLLFNGDYTIHKMMMYMNSALLDEEEISCEDINTTGITGASLETDEESAEKIIVIKNGLYNIDNIVTATVVGGTWDAESEEYAYENIDDVMKDSPSINFYKYEIGTGEYITPSGSVTEPMIVSTEVGKWEKLGLSVGDRVLADGGGLSTITSIEITDTDVTIKFSKELAAEDYLYVYNHTMGDITYGSKGIYLTGYTLMDSDLKPKSLQQSEKLEWQQNILSTLTDYEGIRIALTNKRDIEYRYIVDTFEAFVEEEVHSKLSLICKEKENAFAFINFPAANTFKTCKDTSFVDAQGRFQVQYVVDGRNKQKPASRLFSLASEPNGASFCGYFQPLIFTDGTVKTTVPSAALVSNNFMDKYLFRYPFSCVAGVNYGQLNDVGMVGPDFNYSQADRDLLEPFGVNVIVYEPRRGVYINSNQTAKQKPETSLSKINVRELVIYIQDTIEDMMRNYHWEMNTAELRGMIKSRADKICETIQANGGIYAFFCKCDDENNTPEIIDHEMIVLSVSIEPARGAGKMVQELTLYKTGGLSSVVNQ